MYNFDSYYRKLKVLEIYNQPKDYWFPFKLNNPLNFISSTHCAWIKVKQDVWFSAVQRDMWPGRGIPVHSARAAEQFA